MKKILVFIFIFIMSFLISFAICEYQKSKQPQILSLTCLIASIATILISSFAFLYNYSHLILA